MGRVCVFFLYLSYFHYVFHYIIFSFLLSMWSKNLDSFFFRRIVYNDLYAIAPEQYYKQITNRLAEIHAVSVSF